MAGVLAGPLMVAPQGALTLDYLIVGGGGGGGAETGGGGGGGGVKQGQIPLQAGCAFIIGVGAGGTGAGTGSITNNTTSCREYIFTAECFTTDLSTLYVRKFAKQVSNLGANGGCSFLCSLNADNNCFVVAGGGGGVSVPDVSIVCNIAYMQCIAVAGASGGGGASRNVPDNRINGGAGNTPAASPLQGASGGRGSGTALCVSLCCLQYAGGGGGGGPLGTAGGSSYNTASTSGPLLYGSSSGTTTFTGKVITTGLTTEINSIASTAGMAVGQGIYKPGSGGGSVGDFAKITCINSSTSIIVQATTNNTACTTAGTFVYYTAASAKGGDGTASCITGTNTHYAGGGGGGVTSINSPLFLGPRNWLGYCTIWPGGLGGGGSGGTRNEIGATNGTTNSGGGGGGSGSTILKYSDKSGPSSYSALHRGGHGGSGIVILRYKTGALPVTCTGNPIVSTVGGDTVLCFTGTGQICFGQAVTTVPIEYVVVGGGGSGASVVEQASYTNMSSTGAYASYLGGGGGAGGYLSSSTNLLPNIPISISIGAGGAAAGTTATNNVTARRVGNNGQSTCFGQIMANGGGGGGSRSVNVTSLENTTNSGGCHGGSGGGGAGMLTASSMDITVAYGTAFTSAGVGNCMLITGLCGNSGGTGIQYAAGGGGGASTAGASTTLTSTGGNGCINTTIWPFTNINAYAAGGGGAVYIPSTSQDQTTFYSYGGNANLSYNLWGLGGSGSISFNASCGPAMLRPQNAHPCSWGSGGGGLGIWKRTTQISNTSATQLGLSGQGTSGVVFIKYSAKYPAATVTGSPTYCTDATHRYYRFTGTGTFNIGSPEFPYNYNLSTEKSNYGEGEKIIVHIITKGLANGTQLNWTQTGTLSTSDFLEAVNSGVITVTDNFASLTFTTLRKFTTTNKTFIFNLLDLSNTLLTSLSPITIAGNNQVEYLIVGGGGAGGNDANVASGGGGGGQVCTGTIAITAGTTCTITVGSGGASVPSSYNVLPGNGQPSSALGIIAVGGGVGAGRTFTAQTGTTAVVLQASTTLGGGGGGQAGCGSKTPAAVGTAPGNGGSVACSSANEGSSSNVLYAIFSGAGGGANGPGNSYTNGSLAGDAVHAGGIGCLFLQWAIDTNSGDRGYFGGGGTGGKMVGAKGFGYPNYGGGGRDDSLNNSSTSNNGLANTGGGGAGAYRAGGRVTNLPAVSKNGGSGLVIVRYCANVSAATGGTIYCQNGYVYHKFIATGNLQF